MTITRISMALFLLAPLVGCKGKGGGGSGDSKLESKLSACEASLSDVSKIRSELETELAQKSGEDGEVVVQINGSGGILSIKGKGPNGRTGGQTEVVGNAKDEELYKKFIAAVKKSRNPMTQCYRRALKNDSGLQARTVTVNVKVNYGTSGKVKNAGSSPKINTAFSKCISGVAQKWSLPAMPKPASFVAPLTLTPES